MCYEYGFIQLKTVLLLIEKQLQLMNIFFFDLGCGCSPFFTGFDF